MLPMLLIPMQKPMPMLSELVLKLTMSIGYSVAVNVGECYYCRDVMMKMIRRLSTRIKMSSTGQLVILLVFVMYFYHLKNDDGNENPEWLG